MTIKYFGFQKDDWSFCLLPVIGMSKNSEETTLLLGWLFFGIWITW